METKKRNKHFYILIGILSLLIIVLFFVSMCVGRYLIPISDVFKYFTFQNINSTSSKVIEYLRIPRTLIAILFSNFLEVYGGSAL